MKKRTICLGMILIVLVWVGYGQFYSADKEEPATDITAAVEEPMTRPGFVYITGAVRKPGLYSFDEPIRAAEAVKVAGDALPYADMESINGAEAVYDGMHIHIPYQLEGIPVAGDEHLININEADEKKLMELPGIGAATAKAVLTYRQEHGPFAEPADLQKVKGIGPAKWEKMKDAVTT